MTPTIRPLNLFLGKEDLKIDSKIASALPPSSDDLIPSVAFRLLSASLRTSPFLLPPYPRSQPFSECLKSPRAWIRGYEKPRCAQKSAEKAGATDGIQSAGEGRSALW